MSGIRISDMTPDTEMQGAEIIPVSDAGAARSITTGGIRDFVLKAIEELDVVPVVTGEDNIYILQNGALKGVDINHVSQFVIDAIWGRGAGTAVAGGDIIPLKDAGSIEKVVTAEKLADYILGAIKSRVLDVSGLDAVTPGLGDNLLIVQGTTAKKTTMQAVNDAIYAAFKTYVAGLGAAATPNDTDKLYVIQGGAEKQLSIQTLKGVLGSTVAPSVTTENKIPQWSSAQKTLKNGLEVRTEIRPSASASDEALATERAVRYALDNPTVTAGNGDGAVVLRLGASATEGLETVVVDKVITLGAVAGVDVLTLPAGALLRCVQASVATAAVAGGTSVKIGIGTADDPDAYGLTTAFARNLKIDTLVGTVLAGQTVIKAFPCAGDGASGDTAFSAGAIRVRIIYEQLNSLDDA